MHSPQLGVMQNAVALCTFCKPLFFLDHDSFNELTIRIFYQLKYMCLLILVRTSYMGEDRGLIGHHFCICLGHMAVICVQTNEINSEGSDILEISSCFYQFLALLYKRPGAIVVTMVSMWVWVTL